MIPERFWTAIAHDPDTGCWLWQRHPFAAGYGLFRVDGKRWLIHRYSYTALVGPIPDGLHIDHLCRNRHCVNPDHLEPVTQRENIRRALVKTHCLHGHEFTPENTYLHRGDRWCRACMNRRNREAYARRKAATA